FSAPAFHPPGLCIALLFLLLAPITLVAASDVKRNGDAAARRSRRQGGVRACDSRLLSRSAYRRHCRPASFAVCQNSAPPRVRRPSKKRPAVRQGVRGFCDRSLCVVDADWSSGQGCCGSLPLLKVSNGSQVAQKWSFLKDSNGCGPCGMSDWTI